MTEWEQKLDTFLTFNERDLLEHAGKITAQVAEKLALDAYVEFDQKRREEDKQFADEEDRKFLEEIYTISKSHEPVIHS